MSGDVSRDSYILWIFFSWGITVPSCLIIVGYEWKILGKGGPLCLPPPRKVKDKIGSVMIKEFVKLKPKIYSFLVDGSSEYKKQMV